MKYHRILKFSLITSMVLVLTIFFLYRAPKWPFEQGGLLCLASEIAIGFFLGMLYWLDRGGNTALLYEKTIKQGLWIGLLWTVEIAMNNVIQPGLPLRDILDDIFWGILALLIFIIAFRDALKSNKVASAISSAFWTGLCSGAIACLTALILIVFGMPLITSDPLNIAEWNGQRHLAGTAMQVYFAYQTLAGAVMHLVILGVILGLLIGLIGGLLARISNYVNKLLRNKIAVH
jgi:hypothetical protein